MAAESVYICSATGHVPEHPRGQFCRDHGARLFTHCPLCKAEWPRTRLVPYLDRDDQAPDFCENCGAPAPWLDRRQLIGWLKDRLPDAGLDPITRLKLRDVLDALVAKDADDTRTIAGWQTVRDAAPKVWKLAKPVLDVLIGAAVKKGLDSL